MQVVVQPMLILSPVLSIATYWPVGLLLQGLHAEAFECPLQIDAKLFLGPLL